jgi:hypothetical protein
VPNAEEYDLINTCYAVLRDYQMEVVSERTFGKTEGSGQCSKYQ